MRKLTIPPSAVKLSHSPTVSTPRVLISRKIEGKRLRSDELTNRIWQVPACCASASCLTENDLPCTVCPFTAWSSAPPNGSLPITQMAIGSPALLKACGGHSTNFAKLY